MANKLQICTAVFFFFFHSVGVGADGGGLDRHCYETKATLHVISSGGFAAALDSLIPGFTEHTGIAIDLSYGSSSGGAPDSIPERLKRGEVFDVLIMSRSSLDTMSRQGYVLSETRTDLVRSLIGMAVKEGAPIPDISTEEAFIDVLLSAESIGYSASASGTYLSTRLWPHIGVWETIKEKSIRFESVRVASMVADDRVEIGFQQVSEILPISGVAFAGTIPESMQKVTVFSSGITRQSNDPQIAQCLIDFATSSAAKQIILAAGLEPIEHGREP